MRVIQRVILLALLLGWSLSAYAFTLLVEQVSDRAYALVGDIGLRTAENHALNNTLGFLVTEEGVVLVGSGADPGGAQHIEQQVASVTDQPIRWVVNIGAQDHHWLGNHYFAERGVEIIALERTVTAQQAHVDNHLLRLHEVLGSAAAAVTPYYAPEPLAGEAAELTLGALELRLLWPGDGHFPGDALLWYAPERVALVGDFVFHDRIPGIHPFSNVSRWHAAFQQIAALQPDHIIPGHGHPGDLERSMRDTGAYLAWLVEEVGAAVADWQELDATVEQLADAPAFEHLQYYREWHRRNVHQSYLQLESGRF